MLAKRIIPCLDVKNNKVVKGVQFTNHEVMGDILSLAQKYRDQGADELVFYDITASCEDRLVSRQWVNDVAKILDIPFCVAGGIRSLQEAEETLNAGADKISINSPALERPELIDELSKRFGRQCIVVGIDSILQDGKLQVCQYTGNPDLSKMTERSTLDWVQEVEARGAGEIVLNCMNQDGCRKGYDIAQLAAVREKINIPLIASGGAGAFEDFLHVFEQANVDGALAASVFHKGIMDIRDLKKFLRDHSVEVRYEN